MALPVVGAPSGSMVWCEINALPRACNLSWILPCVFDSHTDGGRPRLERDVFCGADRITSSSTKQRRRANAIPGQREHDLPFQHKRSYGRCREIKVGNAGIYGGFLHNVSLAITTTVLLGDNSCPINELSSYHNNSRVPVLPDPTTPFQNDFSCMS